MNVRELSFELNAKEVCLSNPNREIADLFAGDLLSYAMANAPADCAYFTIMNNVNVAAVASCTDMAVIVVCDNVKADKNLTDAVFREGLNLIETKLDIASAVIKASKLK